MGGNSCGTLGTHSTGAGGRQTLRPNAHAPDKRRTLLRQERDAGNLAASRETARRRAQTGYSSCDYKPPNGFTDVNDATQGPALRRSQMCISRLAFRSTTFSNFAINGAPECFFGAICGTQGRADYSLLRSQVRRTPLPSQRGSCGCLICYLYSGWV